MGWRDYGQKKERTGCNQGHTLSGDPSGISHIDVLGKIFPSRI
jgi:hypothetical protein